MRWKNPGHEFDVEWKKLNIDKDKEFSLYIFGAGKMGTELFEKIRRHINVQGYIDNDIAKIGNQTNGVNIISIDDYCPSQNKKIVIATGKEYSKQIEEQLIAIHLKHVEDYLFIEEFINYYYLIIQAYYYDRIIIRQSQICVTERCTLRCKGCAHGCYAMNSAKSADLSLDEVKRSADYFFTKIDYVNFFSLLGGEPLIYDKLDEAIEYIGKNYRGKIHTFAITTNGTCLPNTRILRACKEYQCIFLISNYTKVIPKIKSRVENLINLLEENEIRYTLVDEENEWIDFGFNYVNNSVEKARSIFDSCYTDCRESRNNKLYYCVMARSVSDNLHIAKCDEYFDMELYDNVKDKKLLLEYELGYSEKGYLEMCKHCNGMNCNDKRIPAGEQVS